MWWLWRHRDDHPHQIAQRAKAITQGRGSHVWFRDNHTALYTIADFLRRPSHYTYNVTHTWRQNMRVSINFVAGRGPFVRRLYHELAKIEKLPMPDEAHFSFVVPQRIRAPSRAVMSCAVIHLHYHWQEAAVLESPLVREIELLLQTELATESGASVRPSAPSAASIAALARGTERTDRAASPQASTAGVGRAGPHLPGDEGKGTRNDGIWTTEVTAAALAARQCRVYVHQVPKATGLRMHPMYSPCAWEHAQHATEVWINRALLGSPWVVSSPADADVVYLDGHHFSEWCAPKGFTYRSPPIRPRPSATALCGHTRTPPASAIASLLLHSTSSLATPARCTATTAYFQRTLHRRVRPNGDEVGRLYASESTMQPPLSYRLPLTPSRSAPTSPWRRTRRRTRAVEWVSGRSADAASR